MPGPYVEPSAGEAAISPRAAPTVTCSATVPRVTDDFWAVIPAGGAGTRLWPLSRANSPKFLRDLTGSGRSLLQATRDRLTGLCDDRMLVVTGRAHADAVAAQLSELPADRVLAEPAPRDSMAAIGLAAAVLERRDPQIVLGSFAADHVIGDEDVFRAAVTEAIAVARENHLVTIGIQPDRPATGFGYIELGDPLDVTAAPSAHRVSSFVEKPDEQTAKGYLAGGRYRWNAGMFVVRAGVLLDLLTIWHPELAAGLRGIAADPMTLDEVWPGLQKIAIDHAVAEPAAAAGRVAVIPGAFGWDDVGDFDSLGTLLPDSAGVEGLKIVGDDEWVVAVDATGVIVPGSGRTIAVVGVPDLVVVDTPDALLVTTRDRAQDVKAVVDRLKSTGRAALT
jgi:mannose-1-phosphate guanylyltransferase